MTRCDCALNGASLSALDPRIRVVDVIETAPQRRRQTADHPRCGMFLLRQTRQHLGVQVRFLLQEEDVVQRRTLMQKVLAWAEPGGLLTTSDRPGQQLHVVCAASPSVSALSWLDELTVEFRAYRLPWWESAAPVSVTTADTAGLTVPGQGEAPVSAEVVNTGADTLTALTLAAGQTRMTFEGLALPAGSAFRLDFADGFLTAAIDGASVLHGRTDDSDDWLLAPCGQPCQVCVTADQPVRAAFSARGRYL